MTMKFLSISSILIGLLCWTTTVHAVDLQISITYDDSPRETMWTFTNDDTSRELFRKDYNSVSSSGTISVILSNLAEGHYSFVIADAGDDGTGAIVLSDYNNANDIYYEHDGDFTSELTVDVVVSATGDVTATEAVDWSHPDPLWPGYSSPAANHSFTLNVKLGNNPTDVSILLKKRDDTYFNTGYLDEYSYYPDATDANTLHTQVFDDIDAGVYILRIDSSSSNGLGSDGWATLTNTSKVFWQIEGDDFTSRVDRAFMVRGYYGNTILVDGYSLP